MNYGIGQSVCPQCGSSADVRTVAELFDMLNGAQGGATQQTYRAEQMGRDNPGTHPDYPSQSYQSADSAGTNTDYPYESYQGPGFPTQSYQSQGPGPAPGYQGPDYPNTQRRPTIDTGIGDDPAREIASAVFRAAAKFAGRPFSKQMQQAFEERIRPVLEARAAKARQQQWQPSRDDQAAIVQRYADLRACLRDWVVFLDGGSRAVPITEIGMPLTLAEADTIVDWLRAP